MADELRKIIGATGTEKRRPDGSIYQSLSFANQQKLSKQCSVNDKEVQIAALEQGIVPEVYARNQKSLLSGSVNLCALRGAQLIQCEALLRCTARIT